MKTKDLSPEKRYKYKWYNIIIYASFFMYLMMMACKGIYTAEINEIVNIFKTDKVTAGIATTCYFITYGSVQLVLSLFYNKVNVRYYLFGTISLSAIITIFLAFATNMMQINVIMALNGVLHAGLWGGCMAVLGKYLPNKQLSRASAIMSYGFAFGNLLAYAGCAICVSIGRWDLPFIIFGILFLVSAVIFFIACGKVDKALPVIDVQEEEKTAYVGRVHIEIDTPVRKLVFYAILLLSEIAIMIAYYGIYNWFADFLITNFNLDTSLSIWISIVAPISIIYGTPMLINACDRHNFIGATGIFVIISLVFILLLIFFAQVNVILSVLLLFGFIFTARACSAVYAFVLPNKMRGQLDAAKYGAFNNGIASFAAGLATPIMQVVINGYGWTGGFVFIGICTFIVLLFIILADYLIKRQQRQNKKIKERL